MKKMKKSQESGRQILRIPNVAPVGSDIVRDPICINVPLVLYSDALGAHVWHPAAMDCSEAERLSTAISAGGGAYAQIVNVPLILPAASSIPDVLGDLRCEPIRVRLLEDLARRWQRIEARLGCLNR